MLTRLRARGFKALRDVEVELEPLTVIVGPNACGKTSVLEVIELVRNFAHASLANESIPIIDEDSFSKGDDIQPVLLAELSAEVDATHHEYIAEQWTEDLNKGFPNNGFVAELEKSAQPLVDPRLVFPPFLREPARSAPS